MLPKRDSDLVIGVDAGTTALKAGVLSATGRVVGLVSMPYPLSSPEPGAMEQDANDWWAALCSALHAVLKEVADAGVVRAIAIGGQSPTLVACDADFRQTHPAVTWLDKRSADEAERLYARLEQPVPVWGSWPAQAAWLARNRPEAMHRTRWLLGCADYLAARLTRSAISSLAYAPEELRAAEIELSLIPPSLGPGELMGEVHPSVADEAGLPAGTPVVAGFVDGLLGLLGSGARSPDTACMNAGTSGSYTAICRPPMGRPFFGVRTIGGAMNTSGKALEWFADKIAPDVADYSALLDSAETIGPGAEGLLFLPYLAGERAPHQDPHVRGAWVGLTLGHDRRHLLRALLEGVAFGFRDIHTSLVDRGAVVHEVRTVGGQARSDLWNQIKADVLGRPVLVPRVVEGPVVGAAMLAGLGVGMFASLEEATQAMVNVARRFEPEARRSARYDELFEIYRSLYPALREASWQLSEDYCSKISMPTVVSVSRPVTTERP